MFPFEHHRHILCPGDPSDLIGDLLAQPLLQLQAMRTLLRNAREFREAQHFFVGDVTNGDITPEWQEMVLCVPLSFLQEQGTPTFSLSSSGKRTHTTRKQGGGEANSCPLLLKKQSYSMLRPALIKNAHFYFLRRLREPEARKPNRPSLEVSQ